MTPINQSTSSNCEVTAAPGVNASDQEKQVLLEQIKAQEEMLARTTNYLLQIQGQLEESKKELYQQNKNLERTVEQRTSELKQVVNRLQKEVQWREKAQQNLSVANHELSVLLYRSSHDFKGPVCTAFGLLSLIGDRIEDAEIREYIQLLQRPLKKLESLTRTITSIADVREHKAGRQETNISVLLNDMLLSFQTAQQSVINPGIDLKIIGVDTVYCDEHLLQSALQNILDNAFRYKVVGRAHQVKVQVQPYYKQLKIIVTDNGTGIPAVFQDRVFDMFFRGSELSAGSGLGLYLSKIAIEKLGGKVEIRSIENEGTSVITYLPIL